MNTRFRAMLCLVGSVLLLSACGQSSEERALENALERQMGDEADVQVDGEKFTITTEDGTYTGGGDLPDNWPGDAPIYPDAKVVYSGSTTDGGQSSMGVTVSVAASVDEVWAFYEEALPANGWTVENTMRSAGFNVLGGSKGSRVLSVMIAEVEGQTSITLGVEEGQAVEEEEE